MAESHAGMLPSEHAKCKLLISGRRREAAGQWIGQKLTSPDIEYAEH
jgi:hypothetical protein